MSYYPRWTWGARKRRRHPGTLDPAKVVGIALHWPAMDRRLRRVADVKAALRGWQRFHMDNRGWSDIAYQVAVDQQGNRYRLRGHKFRSAANGNTALNLSYGAILLVLAPGEKPSDAMIAGVRRVIAAHRRRYPNSSKIVGHGQIRPGGTECPGTEAQTMIDAGEFEPRPRKRQAVTR